MQDLSSQQSSPQEIEVISVGLNFTPRPITPTYQLIQKSTGCLTLTCLSYYKPFTWIHQSKTPEIPISCNLFYQHYHHAPATVTVLRNSLNLSHPLRLGEKENGRCVVFTCLLLSKASGQLLMIKKKKKFSFTVLLAIQQQTGCKISKGNIVFITQKLFLFFYLFVRCQSFVPYT